MHWIYEPVSILYLYHYFVVDAFYLYWRKYCLIQFKLLTIRLFEDLVSSIEENYLSLLFYLVRNINQNCHNKFGQQIIIVIYDSFRSKYTKASIA